MVRGPCLCTQEIRKFILQEAHDSPYSIHPRNTKMYLDLKERFWWTGMKKDIAEYVVVCDVCQRVKAEHQKPAGLLQPMPIPEWKWDKLGMDFITRLPRTRSGYDSIWVVVISCSGSGKSGNEIHAKLIPTSIRVSTQVVVILLASDALLLLSLAYITYDYIVRNIQSTRNAPSNPNTSWCFQGESSMVSHEPLEVFTS